VSRRSLLITGLLVVAVAVGGWLFNYFYKAVDEDIYLPPQGEAAFNPLYALKKSLQAQGIRAISYPSLNPAGLALGPRDTLVLFTRPEALAPAQAQRLLDWVQQGGHLVMPGPDSSGDPGPLAAGLGLKSRYADDDASKDSDDDDSYNDCQEIGPGKQDKETAFTDCATRFISSSRDFVLSGGDDQHGYRFGRREFGQGVATVTNLSFLDNRRLESPVSQELAYQLLAPRLGQGSVHLVYSADVPSLWRLMLLYGWPALLPLALALACWLALRSQRFGPVLPRPPTHRRALLEHVQAAGEFAYRRGRASALHTSVLNLFRQRLQRRDPAIAALDGEALVLALSERLSLDAQRIRQALKPFGQRRDWYLHSISTLLQMRNRL
jgi:hypothetical protein